MPDEPWNVCTLFTSIWMMRNEVLAIILDRIKEKNVCLEIFNTNNVNLAFILYMINFLQGRHVHGMVHSFSMMCVISLFNLQHWEHLNGKC